MNVNVVRWVPFGVQALLAGAWAVGAGAEPAPKYTRNVAIAIWNGAEILDWAGPSEVFAAAGRIASRGDALAFNVYTVSKTRDPIVSQGFVDVVPDYTISDAPEPDIVVLPGGGGRSVLNDPAFFAWASQAARDAEVALSVCTGAFILARAGLLDEKTATTWYGALDNLEKQFPNINVQRGSRFVDNGQVVTTAGVSAGIDGSLHVVARLLGRHVADRTAEYMEYRWTPEPYLAKDYALLNPSLDERGRLLQQAEIHARAKSFADAIRICEQLVEEDPDDEASWLQLGAACYASKRYADATRAYARAAPMSDDAARVWYNAACSAALDENEDRALEYLAKAIDAGFTGYEHARNDADLAGLRDDPRFDTLLSKAASSNDRAAER